MAPLAGFEITFKVCLGAVLTEAFGAGFPLPVVTFLGVVGFDTGFSTTLAVDLEALG